MNIKPYRPQTTSSAIELESQPERAASIPGAAGQHGIIPSRESVHSEVAISVKPCCMDAGEL